MTYAAEVRISWDEAKNVANQKKHGLRFEEAAELFRSGSDYLEIFDEAHSDSEDRFIAIGPISRGLVLMVWTAIEEDVVRIISARWATQREQALYHSSMEGYR